jgi:hypothetical protein
MITESTLSLESQKLLTEWLGECWHEYNSRKCITCIIMEPEDDPPRLDFSDWRVTGRLIEKAEGIVVIKFDHTWNSTIEGDFQEGSSPQLAICNAIVAYLKEE